MKFLSKKGVDDLKLMPKDMYQKVVNRAKELILKVEQTVNEEACV
jgi:hypothetical protein